MADKGGKRPGAGRKSKAEEAKVNHIFTTALKRLYSKEEDEEAKIEFVIDLSKSSRGQIFIAEHLFGKPKEIKQLELDTDTLEQIALFRIPDNGREDDN